MLTSRKIHLILKEIRYYKLPPLQEKEDKSISIFYLFIFKKK